MLLSIGGALLLVPFESQVAHWSSVVTTYIRRKSPLSSGVHGRQRRPSTPTQSSHGSSTPCPFGEPGGEGAAEAGVHRPTAPTPLIVATRPAAKPVAATERAAAQRASARDTPAHPSALMHRRYRPHRTDRDRSRSSPRLKAAVQSFATGNRVLLPLPDGPATSVMRGFTWRRSSSTSRAYRSAIHSPAGLHRTANPERRDRSDAA